MLSYQAITVHEGNVLVLTPHYIRFQCLVRA